MLGRHIRNIIKESLDDLNWIGSSELNFDLKHKFNGNIKQITSTYDVPMSFDKGISPEMIRQFLNYFGPMYLFELDGVKYLYQDRGDYEWFIDEEGYDYVDNEIPEKLRVADMGLRFSDILDIYFDENKGLNESLDDLDWIRSSESGFDPNFEFKNFEYWVDLSTLTDYEITLVRDYILKVLSDINLSGDIARKFSNLRSYRGIIIHCGSDATDYQPEKNNLCFMDIPFEEDENIENSVYVDGREVLGYIKYTEEDEELDESLEWVDKDNTYGGDERFSTDPTWKGDDNWSTNPERSYWKQGDAGSSGGGEDVNESDEDWSWLEDTGEHPSYNGHPQGVVYLRDHDEIDEFCDIIENYNGGELPRGGARENLHSGLENSRDELEGSDYDPSNAVLSASFFVERKIPGILSVGYWGYDVGHYDITEWLSYEDTFNQEYHLYTNLNQVREIFKDYQNPELIKESTDPDWEWLNDVPDTVPFEMVELDKKYRIKVTEDLRDALESCGDNLRMFLQGYYGVATRSKKITYNQIHCDSEIEDEIFSLQIVFYDIDDKEISYFWVSSNMVDFYEI